MNTQIQAKLVSLTQGFLQGQGYGAVYEAMYLAYLDCLWVPYGVDFWPQYIQYCEAKAPPGFPARNLASFISDPSQLVGMLEDFRSRVKPTSPVAEKPSPEPASNSLAVLFGF